MWSDEGAEPWVVEVLRWGYQIPFRRAPTLSKDPIPLPAYSPNSNRGKALEGEVQSLLSKGAIELAPLPSPGFYSRLFVVMKASGAWEAGHRPFHSELEDSTDILQDGYTSICSSFDSPGRLDGVSGFEGCVLAGPYASGFLQVPQVLGGGGGRGGVPIQSPLFRSFHGSASFYQGHGSCVSDSSQDGGTASAVPRRLVDSGFLT